MDEEYQCEYCDKTFPEENAKQQHVRAVHPEEVTSASEVDISKHWFILGGLLLVLGGVLYLYGGSLLSWWTQEDLPTVTDHWHSTYKIKLCGETLPPFPRQEGDIHTHGNGRIHIHPHSQETAGKAANLEAFVRSIDGVLTDTKIGVPIRGTYENGDSCPNGKPGKLRVIVNGETIDNPASYVPQDGDNIIIEFGPESSS
ncbi:MAG: hypothetical protein ABEK50_15335 [bacterium]